MAGQPAQCGIPHQAQQGRDIGRIAQFTRYLHQQALGSATPGQHRKKLLRLTERQQGCQQ